MTPATITKTCLPDFIALIASSIISSTACRASSRACWLSDAACTSSQFLSARIEAARFCRGLHFAGLYASVGSHVLQTGQCLQFLQSVHDLQLVGIVVLSL
jgi:hypothetical protein